MQNQTLSDAVSSFGIGLYFVQVVSYNTSVLARIVAEVPEGSWSTMEDFVMLL